MSEEKMIEWQPIHTLFDDPKAEPLMVYEDGVMIIYGTGNGEILLGRDIRFGKIGDEWGDLGSLDWFSLYHFYDDKEMIFNAASTYEGKLRKPTHWMKWPSKPKGIK